MQLVVKVEHKRWYEDRDAAKAQSEAFQAELESLGMGVVDKDDYHGFKVLMDSGQYIKYSQLQDAKDFLFTFGVARIMPEGQQPEEAINRALEKYRPQGPSEANWNSRVEVHMPGHSLSMYNEVLLMEDQCTDALQDALNQGWRIIAACPQPDARRPDYILGRFNPEIMMDKCASAKRVLDVRRPEAEQSTVVPGAVTVDKFIKATISEEDDIPF